MVDLVSVEQVVEGFEDMRIFQGEDCLGRLISTSDISRPALELTGYFKFYPAERIQLFGKTEMSYLEGLSHARRKDILSGLATEDTPLFVISRNIEPMEEMYEICEERQIPLLGSPRRTTQVSSAITNLLERYLAERQSVHGVLMDIHGMGVLITGDSGIGKSETALDLVHKGHRLVSDDRVDVREQGGSRIIGESPEVTRNMMEIRGVGIVDVSNLFGIRTASSELQIELITYLEDWDDDKQYDRLGTDIQTRRFFNVDIPQITIPVKPGRNVATIIETAALLFRSRTMGYDAAEQLNKNIEELMAKNMIRDQQKKES